MDTKRFNSILSKLQEVLKKEGCDALLVQDEVNLYYLTGLTLSQGQLLVHQKGACLIVDSRYFETCQKKSPWPVVLLEKGALGNVIENLGEIQTVGFNTLNTTYSTFIQLEGEIKARLIPLNGPVETLRQIKTDEEIKLLKEAAQLGLSGYDYILTLIREGVTEKELAVELEIFWKRKGGRKVSFDPIIAFGAASSMPHYRAGSIPLQKNQSILIDIGVNYNHYHSDMTRMVYFGKPDPKMVAIHAIVQEAQAVALSLCHPGVTIGELDAGARGFIEKKGYGERFTHSLGHGIGLEVHELPHIRNKPPTSEVKLEAGMVITIEPGIYLPGVGGVRIEDTVVVTDNGYENLTDRDKSPKIIL
jgi:Xaa-Pro aminopeptidase